MGVVCGSRPFPPCSCIRSKGGTVTSFDAAANDDETAREDRAPVSVPPRKVAVKLPHRLSFRMMLRTPPSRVPPAPALRSRSRRCRSRTGARVAYADPGAAGARSRIHHRQSRAPLAHVPQNPGDTTATALPAAPRGIFRITPAALPARRSGSVAPCRDRASSAPSPLAPPAL